MAETAAARDGEPGNARNRVHSAGRGRHASARGGRRSAPHTRTGGETAATDADWRRRDDAPIRSTSRTNGSRTSVHARSQPASSPVKSLNMPAAVFSGGANAIVGACLTMCSREEVVKREQIKDISRFERPPLDARGHGDGDGAIALWAVKKYRRPAAGRIDMDVAQLRPPQVLAATLCHLFTNVLPWRRSGFDWHVTARDASSAPPSGLPSPPEFLTLYHFLNDRLRSIRQDFVIQRVRGRARVAALVQTARFYVLASFRAMQVLDTSDTTLDWSEPLNDQQLASALTEVHAQYEHGSEGTSADALHQEAIAYDVLLHLGDPRAVSLLLLKVPSTLLDSDASRSVLALFTAFHTGDFVAFFRVYRRLPILQQCLTMRHLPSVWTSTLLRMNKAFGKIDRFALSEIAQWTDLPDAAAARLLCTAMNVHIEDDKQSVPVAATAESWEEAARITTQELRVQGMVHRHAGYAQFKIQAIRNELAPEVERELLRGKAASIQNELMGRFTATTLVMEG